MLFHRWGFCGLARLFVTFGGSGGIMTTAGPELPYPCSSQAKTRDERDSLPWKNALVQRISGILSSCNMQISNSKLCESSKC